MRVLRKIQVRSARGDINHITFKASWMLPTECIDKLIEAGNLMKSQINAVYHFQPAAVDNWDAALGRWNNRQQEVTE